MMYTISNMPLRARSYWVVVVSSMEQIIGAGLSTVVGVILPMLSLWEHTDLSPVLQGVIGSTGLIGIAIGSPIIGKMCDRHGYLLWFRLCPILIMLGGVIGFVSHSIPLLILGLLIAGIGTGGGYSLDSAYIGELLPDRWKLVMVGVAKASCAFGFIGFAAACWVWLDIVPVAEIWNKLMLTLVAAGLITFIMRIRWAESPKWLLEQGRRDEALKALNLFYGTDVELPAENPSPAMQKSAVATKTDNSWLDMFRGENLRKTILCGVPWACEGLGVYGFGVFLPVLVMALGIDKTHVVGVHKVINSVEITTLVNFFILPGFIIGLLIMRRVSHVKMLSVGFIFSAIGLLVLYCGYLMHWASWVMILGFMIFEIALNGGPHLVTYVLPSQVYPVSDRGAGSGLAAMNGKIGAVVGVVVMPLLLDAGGPSRVLLVSIAVMLLGALVTFAYRNVVTPDPKL